MKTYKIKLQISATEFETIEVKAETQREAWFAVGNKGVVGSITEIKGEDYEKE